jgi:hypothetical protein
LWAFDEHFMGIFTAILWAFHKYFAASICKPNTNEKCGKIHVQLITFCSNLHFPPEPKHNGVPLILTSAIVAEKLSIIFNLTDIFRDVGRRGVWLLGVGVLPVGRVGEEVLEGGQGEGPANLRHVLEGFGWLTLEVNQINWSLGLGRRDIPSTSHFVNRHKLFYLGKQTKCSIEYVGGGGWVGGGGVVRLGVLVPRGQSYKKFTTVIYE